MNFKINSPKKIILSISYVLASIWGILFFTAIMTDPQENLNGLSLYSLIGALFSLILLITSPLGCVFAVDRYFQNKEKKHAVHQR